MTCFLALQMPLAFADWHGVVERVLSGDTIMVNYQGGLYNVRLYGVATPKNGQSYGPTAREATSRVVMGRDVDVQRIYADGNTDVAIVYIHDQYSLQSYLTGSGLAWVNESNCSYDVCSNWLSMQEQARDAERGLWSEANPIAPWNWRSAVKTKKKAHKPKVVHKQKKRHYAHRKVTGENPSAEAAVQTSSEEKAAVPVQKSGD